MPGRLPGLLERGARGRRVADADELGLGVPAEALEGIEVLGRVVSHAAMVSGAAPVTRSQAGNSRQCPSEITSTTPSTTLIAVWSSIA